MIDRRCAVTFNGFVLIHYGGRAMAALDLVQTGEAGIAGRFFKQGFVFPIHS